MSPLSTAVPLVTVDIPDPGNIDIAVSLGSGATGAFLTTLFVGAILVAFAPDYTERMMATVTEDAVGSFLYGLAALLAVIVVTIALVITLVGILLAIPFALLAAFIWAVGASIAYLAVADRLLDRGDSWLLPLVVAALINGGLTLTGIGALVSFCVGAAGFGAVLRDRLS
jgi:hypothetical protein